MVKVAFYRPQNTGRILDKIICWWTRGPYSHCEIAVDERPDGSLYLYTSQILEKGVVGRWRYLKPLDWDIIEIDVPAEKVKEWFDKRIGSKYDLFGLLGFVWRRGSRERGNKYFCSEACAASIGIPEAWRYDPNTLKCIVEYIAKGK